MRAFLLGCLAAVLLAVVAAYTLNSGYLPNASSSVFTTEAVRI
jgi:hypothetical protein